MIKKSFVLLIITLFIFCGINEFVHTQQKYNPPYTILPESIIKLLINEISGQLALNNEIMLAGYNHIRSAEEFNTHFYESEYLTKKLKEYGLEDVLLEDVGKTITQKGGNWWARVDAELRMIEPEEKLLSRLVEHPALMARFCDSGDWEGELIYLDARDYPNINQLDLNGKIILTPEYPSRLTEAISKGALGIISYYTYETNFSDPTQVMFNMRFNKGETKRDVFCFQIWRQLGEQLKKMIFEKHKVVLHAKAQTASYPYKLDSVSACIKGTRPELKGIMLTSHLFERPIKQGANDNISGSVTITEIARALTTLIKQGKLQRPERSIYFLMSEEGSGTMGFFRQHPEMTEKVLAVINMDMVGEDLDKNQAFFIIEKALYSRSSFLETVTIHFADFVFATNTARPTNELYELPEQYPIPILDKNGSNQPFRYIVGEYMGSSDHGMFIENDSEIPAVMFSIWPDRWFHSDKDRPDKSDSTQIKRAAFIGAASVWAVSAGKAEFLENLIRITYQNCLKLIQDAFNNSINQLSLTIEQSYTGNYFLECKNNIHQAILMGKQTLSSLENLTHGKEKLKDYLNSLIRGLDDLLIYYTKMLENDYRRIAQLKGIAPLIMASTSEEQKLLKQIPVKNDPVPLGKIIRFSQLNSALKNQRELMLKIYREYSHLFLLELYLCIDGKRTLKQIRDFLSFEFKPLSISDFLKIINGLVDAKLIQLIQI